MGLTNQAMGIKAVDSGLEIRKQSVEDYVVALAGNPNVGKSTVFNSLTGLNQHTGNWPGKTVANAQGYANSEENSYVLVDIPGTYSLMAHSQEEEVARNFICFGEPDAVVVVCDGTCLEHNLNLVLQTIEITENVVVCVNLMDEAKRKNIHIDLELLSKKLGVPVVGTIAREKKTLKELMHAVDQTVEGTLKRTPLPICYPTVVEGAIALLEPVVEKKINGKLNSRWLSLKLLDQDASLGKEINTYLGYDFFEDEEIKEVLAKVQKYLEEKKVTSEKIKDQIVLTLVLTAESISSNVVKENIDYMHTRDHKIDRIITSKRFGYPLMIVLLAVVFWLTITGANYPSQLLSEGLFYIQDRLTDLFHYLNAPEWLRGILILGGYRVLAWVVSVMLPPMAIFFPLFTLLEDAGYLPRIAYNLDRPFKRCCACGKQALTMCMGEIGMQELEEKKTVESMGTRPCVRKVNS